MVVNRKKTKASQHPSFRVVSQSEQEERDYNYVQFRTIPKPTSVVGSIAHIIKGALGAGILGGHVAYMKAGAFVALPLHIAFGVYMTFCLHLLVKSAQILYRRTKVPTMSYPDVGEASLACFPNAKVAKLAKLFRYIIDVIICIDLYGSCACYQLIIAKSLKQLVENTHETAIHGIGPGYPDLRVYLAIMIIPTILICLITHLKWLAPFSIAANFVILLCCILAIYYAFENNPRFENLIAAKTFYNTLEFSGIVVFSMSCAGVVVPIENNMKEPHKFTTVLLVGMSTIVAGTCIVAFFGYSGYLESSEAPITVNFPMNTVPKIFKGLICIMIYVTHAVNFWPPFEICFYYLKRLHKGKFLMWELIYRAICVTLISIVAIVFPAVSALMGFLGSFCLSNMAFIWPVLIHTLVIWQRPGFGKYNWIFWRNLALMAIGFFLLVCGGIVNTSELVSVFIETNVRSSKMG